MNNKRLIISIILTVCILLLGFEITFVASKIITEPSAEISESTDKHSNSEKESGKDIYSRKSDKKPVSKSDKEISEDTQTKDTAKEDESSQDEKLSPESEEPVSDEPSSVPESEKPPEPSASSVESAGHNPGFLSSLESAGYSVDDLTQLSCKQLITVNSTWNTAAVSFYEMNDGVWEEDYELTTNGYVGSMGVSRSSREGSCETPFGLYGVGDAFYIDNKPETSLDTFQVTEDTYWVDDPNSEFYNKRVEGTQEKDWNSAEHMIEYYQSYRYGFVIEFNTQNIIPGKGSAIFFHISRNPTAGCVGVSDTMMLEYLKKLDNNLNPYILIQ